MVHPRVLEMAGLIQQSFRIWPWDLVKSVWHASLRNQMDIRGFYQGDVRSSEQFK